MKAEEEPTPSPNSEVDSFRCAAGATVGKLVLRLATSMVAMDRGDGRPPIALWAAVVAEDWPVVLREWDYWVSRDLEATHASACDWRSAAACMIGSAGEVLQKEGVAGPPTDLLAAWDAREPREVLRAWRRWIAREISTLSHVRQADEWARYVEILPPARRDMAAEHPAIQAEIAATEFEAAAVDGRARDLLSGWQGDGTNCG